MSASVMSAASNTVRSFANAIATCSAMSITASGPCTAGAPNGSTITLTGVGPCTVTASQAGNAVYNAAPDKPLTFSVSKASQTITFGNVGPKTLAQSPVIVSASSSSTLPVTFTASPARVCSVSGTSLSLLRTGNCTVVAHQAGDAVYLAAPTVSQSFTIS